MSYTEKLKILLKKIEMVDYLNICMRNITDKRARLKIINLFRNPETEAVILNRIGNLDKGRILYYIDPVRSYTSGFCSDLAYTLFCCKYADEHGYIPELYFKKISHYKEKEVFMGTSVFLEYFFQKLSSIYDQNEFAWTTYNCSVHFNRYLKQYYDMELRRKVYCEMMKKFFHFNEKTLNELKICEEKFLPNQKKVLGVKYRGTGYKLPVKDHPLPIPMDKFIGEVDKVLHTGKYDAIFLATEDIEALETFKLKYDCKTLLYNSGISRYTKEKTHVDNASRSDVNNPAYKEGLDLLKDVWVLSKCDGFLGSNCGVSEFVPVFNEVYSDKRFEYMKIMDIGTRTWGKNSVEMDKRNKINDDV